MKTKNSIGFEFCGGKWGSLILLFVSFATNSKCEELLTRPDFDPPRIIPEKSEYLVKSENNLTLRCEGKRPITWVLPENFKMDDLTEAASIISASETPDEEYPYGLLLELFNVSTMDVGYYTCKYNSTEYDTQYTTADLEKLGFAKSIYVYVYDPQRLFVPTEMFVHGIQYNPITIPCRPSSPDVNVTLFRDNEEISNESSIFDNHSGFSIYIASPIGNSFLCRAEHEGVQNELTVNVIVPYSTTAPKPTINDSSNGYAELGGTISLECIVKTEFGFMYKFEWTIPNKEAFKENRITLTNTTVKNNGQNLVNQYTGTSNLLLRDVTSKDDGIYKCEIIGVTDNSNYAEKVIKVLEKNQSILNLSEPSGQYKFDVREGQKFAQWNIEIHAYPNPQITWYDNHHRELSSAGWSDDHSNKYEVRTTHSSSRFRINKVTLADSGTYQLKAANEYETKTVNVTLIVRAKPVVKVPSEKFHIYGSIVGELCIAEGYPLPDIKWNFKPCISDEECRSVKEEPVSKKFYSTKSSSPIKVSSVLSMNATQSGYLTCIGTNNLGSDSATTTFLVTDIEYGFGIFESQEGPLEVTQGDNVSMTCAASFYNYTDDLSWNKLPNTESNFSTFKHRTNYSNQITLNIPSIEIQHGGEYECKATRIRKVGDGYKPSETRSLTIQVSEPFGPIITDSNISNEDQSVNLGEQNVTFYCNFDGRPRPTVKWLKDGIEWSPTDDRILVVGGGSKIAFAFIKDGDEGKYSCEAENRVGSASKYVNLILKNKFQFKTGYIAIISAIILLFIIMIIYLVWRIGKEKRIRKELSLVGLLNFEEGQTQSLNPELGVDEQAELLPYDRKWEFPREKLKLGKQLGSGAFGVVMKADAFGLFDAEEVTTVAVKMVKKTAEAAYIKALASELKIMVHLGKHLNVVNLLGACTKNVIKRELLVIVEYCRYGNVHNYLLKHRGVYVDQVDHTTGSIDPAMGVVNRAFSVGSKSSGHPEADYRENLHSAVTGQTTLSSEGVSTSPHGEDSMNDCGQNSNGSMQPEWRSNYKGDYNYSATQIRPLCTRDLLCWAFQVARGMDYLAQRKVMHGDLAARNILLADDNVVKICDFGLAKSMYKSDNYKKKGDGLLPLKWMAIESIRDRIFSTQSDVWSFGIVLWELFSLARTPYPGMDADEKLYNKLVEGYRMEKPSYANNELYEVMLDCWRAKPVQRPSFSELDAKLGGLLEESVRSHYIDLNSPYLEMNNAWLAEKGQDNDYLAMMNAPDYGNIISPNAGRDYVNAPFGGPVTVNIQSPDETDAEGYLCMSPPAKDSVIFSPHPNKNDVFDFQTPPMQRKAKVSQVSDGTELTPMLSKDNKPTRGSESDGDLPSPMSYKPSSLNNIIENSAIVSNDNYVNMSNQKSVLNNGKVNGNNLEAFSNPSYIIMNSTNDKLVDVKPKQYDSSLYVN